MCSHTPAEDSVSPAQKTTSAVRSPIVINSPKSPKTPTKKRKIEVSDEFATPVCPPKTQCDRLIRKLRRKSAAAFLYRCQQELHAAMSSICPEHIVLTRAPAPIIKRRRLVFVSEPKSPASAIDAVADFRLSATERIGNLDDVVPLLDTNERTIDHVIDAFNEKLSFQIPAGRCFDLSSIMNCL